jgi:hypothetical protein
MGCVESAQRARPLKQARKLLKKKARKGRRNEVIKIRREALFFIEMNRG